MKMYISNKKLLKAKKPEEEEAEAEAEADRIELEFNIEMLEKLQLWSCIRFRNFILFSLFLQRSSIFRFNTHSEMHRFSSDRFGLVWLRR